jgi:hypothetical protein
LLRNVTQGLEELPFKVSENSAEENVWTYEGVSGERLEETA